MTPRILARRRILVVAAGGRRNEKVGSPTEVFLESQDGERIERVLIYSPAKDTTAKRISERLAKRLKQGKPRSITELEVPDYAGDHRARTAPTATEAFKVCAQKICVQYPKVRGDSLEVVVSTLTGSPAHWSLMLDALEDSGATVTLLVLTNAGYCYVGAPAPDAGARTSPKNGRIERTTAQHRAALRGLPDSGVVLVTGETGTGKTRFVQQLHADWGSGHDLVAMDCGALPQELVESELFGAVKGAFTGATATRKGAFARAANGTLFLDEIGEVGPLIQAKLLTSLDVDTTGKRTYRPVGGREAKAQLRLILGTNRDLHASVAERRFRLDLLARISTHEVHLPPLRDTPHRVLGAYLTELERQSAHFTRYVREQAAKCKTVSAEAEQDKLSVTFTLPRDTLVPLFELLLRSPADAWLWNYRDAAQSAERLALATWNQRNGQHHQPQYDIDCQTMREELAFLQQRWKRLGGVELGAEPLEELKRAYPSQFATWNVLERHEAQLVLAARTAHPKNSADAYRAYLLMPTI